MSVRGSNYLPESGNVGRNLRTTADSRRWRGRDGGRSGESRRRTWGAPVDGRNRGKSVLADRDDIGHDPAVPRLGSPRNVVILVYPGVQSLDVTGPLEVFSGAQQLLESDPGDRRDRGYRVSIVSPDGSPLATSSGLTIIPHADLVHAPARIDTLLVAGGAGAEQACADPALLEWVAARAARARRVASVCTGAFLLAAAGVLEGRRATTHWAAAAELARRHPLVSVDPTPIFVRDGPVWTSAGVSAGMDLALALVEEDLDREAALTIARHLVLFLRRPGNQSQFSATLAARAPERPGLREVQRFAVENLAGDLSVESLARRAHMSPRHFARSFRVEVGLTPARYVERLRLEAARRRLEESEEPVAAVAAACGFGTAETMRRVFLRALGVGPAEYRRRFHSGRRGAPRRGLRTTTHPGAQVRGVRATPKHPGCPKSAA
jgi:transcriptional regulator GlxA family with amidase domain